VSGLKLIIDNRVVNVIDELIRRGENPRPLLGELGEYLLESTQQRFAEKLSPEGVPWEPVSAAYAERKRAGRATSHHADARTNDPDDILRLTFQLSENVFYQVNDRDLLIGSAEPYAAAHQWGYPKRNLVARPWLGISEKDAREIEAIASDYLLGDLLVAN
jgi:phage virion morphogenesis protein